MAMGLHSPGGRGNRRGRASRSSPMAEINVTPLVDVMLVLLIIFMVTAPLLATGVPIDLPETNARPLDQPSKPPVQISIDDGGTVYIDDAPVSMAGLPAKLDALAAADAGAAEPRTIMLRGAKGLAYDRVMQVMGELNRAGLNRVSLVTTGSDGEN